MKGWFSMSVRELTINMIESMSDEMLSKVYLFIKSEEMQEQLDEEACIEMCKKFDANEDPDKFEGITIEEYARINGISI